MSKLKEEILKKFWERVRFVAPSDINADEVGVVSDEDAKWLMDSYANHKVEELKKEIIKLAEEEIDENAPVVCLDSIKMANLINK